MSHVAFYKGKGKLFNRLIRMWQWLSGYKNWRVSHVEFLREYDERTDTWLCYSASAMDGGVRAKNIRIDKNKWIIKEVGDAGHFADQWMRDHYGKKYDWLGIFAQVFKSIEQNRKKYFCNEAVQEMIGMDGEHNPASMLEAIEAIEGSEIYTK